MKGAKSLELNAVYLVNGIGIAILACITICNSSLIIRGDKGLGELRLIMLVCAISLFVDPLMFKLDGIKGDDLNIILKIGNSWGYLAGALVSALWLRFMTVRVYGTPKKFGINIIMHIFVALHAALLVVNGLVSKPLFFNIDRLNVYHRGPYCFWFVVSSLLPVAASIVMSLVLLAKKKRARQFSAMFLIIPAIALLAVQMFFYGFSLTWVAVAIGCMCVTFVLLNEEKFHDSLTGLYNRAYFDHLTTNIIARRGLVYDGIMIDINSFKSINDQYGHAKGDEALKITAEALLRSCDNTDIIIRYAGDEFVVLMPPGHRTSAEDTVGRIKSCVAELFSKYDAEYSLTLSCGCDTFDSGKERAEEFMNRIDMAMLVNKRRFYEEHPQFERRRH